MPRWLANTALRKPGPRIRLLMLALAVGAPIVLVLAGGPIVTAALDAQRLATAATNSPSGAETYQDVLNDVLVIYLAFGALVGLAAAAIRAFVHEIKGAGKAWDGAGKCLALTAALIVALAAFVRFEAGPGQYINLFSILAALVGAGIFAWLLYALARWVQKVES